MASIKYCERKHRAIFGIPHAPHDNFTVCPQEIRSLRVAPQNAEACIKFYTKTVRMSTPPAGIMRGEPRHISAPPNIHAGTLPDVYGFKISGTPAAPRLTDKIFKPARTFICRPHFYRCRHRPLSATRNRRTRQRCTQRQGSCICP